MQAQHWFRRIADYGHSSALLDGTFDPFFRWNGFLAGPDFAPRIWRPVLKGRPEAGDIIAHIRDMSDPRAILDQSGVNGVAKAVVAIRNYFIPRRGKSLI